VGPTVDGRIKPDIMARGSSNVVASPSNDHNYTTASGTSFSCPLSAGVAALILCVNPNLTPLQVRDAMRNTASQSSSPDNLYGWGILNTLDAINYFPPAPTTFQLSIDVNDGWNMASIPGLHPVDQNVDTWWAYRDMSADVFQFDAGYQTVNEVIPGKGYWMKHSGARTYNTGDEWPVGGILFVPHDPIPIKAGWNIISVYENPVSSANLTTSPPAIIEGPVYGYDGGYSVAFTLYPGFSYWLKSSADGFLIIPEAMSKSNDIEIEYFNDNWGKIIFTDAAGSRFTLYAVNEKLNLNQYEMPPLPPAGVFDIRFSSNRIAEEINSSIQGIDMRGITYPLTVRVENMDMRVMDETGKIVNLNLKKGEDVVISDATIQKLMVTGELIPDKYALEQNYPNPFNPTTTIEFSLPETGNVTLTVYNLLGQKVTELVNTKLESGIYTYQWDAGNEVTGMYIYELRTDKFVSVKKMILLK
jgi:hypothetical protein